MKTDASRHIIDLPLLLAALVGDIWSGLGPILYTRPPLRASAGTRSHLPTGTPSVVQHCWNLRLRLRSRYVLFPCSLVSHSMLRLQPPREQHMVRLQV